MRLPSLHSLSFTAKAALAAITLIPLYYFSYTLRNSHATTGALHGSSSSSISFVDQWVNSTLLGPLNTTSIRAHCATTKWRPSLIFKLDESNGGIGNVRAHVLDFTLFAIEAGAAIILPGMTVRSTSDLFDVWHGQQANFSRMFDEEFFVDVMGEACPQMKIYRLEEVERMGARVHVIGDGYDARSRRVDFDAEINSREAAVEYTTQWLKDHGVDGKTLSQVSVRHTMWEVDTRSLGSELRRNFGQMFAFRPDTCRYAAVAVRTLATKYNLPINPSDRLHAKAYYGAHLRTEQDTVSAGWFKPNTATEVGLNYTEQTDAYLAHAAENSLRVMYVATGNATELERFKIKAASDEPPVTVTSKWDLLTPTEAEELGALDWDQQALVDMEILMKCSVFGGFAKSSYSFAIAVARNAYLEARGMPQGYNWRMKEVDSQVAFDDGLSRILGRNQLNEEKVPRGAWP